VNQALQDIHEELDNHENEFNMEAKTPKQTKKNPPLSVYGSTFDRLSNANDSVMTVTNPAIKALWKNCKTNSFKCNFFRSIINRKFDKMGYSEL
jgi:hypothetical protein